jgi:hypothetical protein
MEKEEKSTETNEKVAVNQKFEIYAKFETGAKEKLAAINEAVQVKNLEQYRENLTALKTTVNDWYKALRDEQFDELADDENLGEIDALIELLREKMPKQWITVLNIPRYLEAMNSVESIVRIVKEDCPNAEVRVYFDELIGTALCLSIVADVVNVYHLGAFCRAVAPATTMEVIPRIDERLEMGFTYQGVKFPLAPAE